MMLILCKDEHPKNQKETAVWSCSQASRLRSRVVAVITTINPS